MHPPIQHPGESRSNPIREDLTQVEPRSQRTFTPTQMVISHSAGVFHWTPEGRKLFDFTSGVLVANLGHNPCTWMERFFAHMGYKNLPVDGKRCRPDCPPSGSCAGAAASGSQPGCPGFFQAAPMTAYNAMTPVERDANALLLKVMRQRPGGTRMEQVLWAASGSEAIQKALWASMAFDKTRDMILATRFGFHGKKGLSCAITGSESDKERDPRVRFISFPMKERIDLSQRNEPFDFGPYRRELEQLWQQFGPRIGSLCTEPYLGGGGSFHPPAQYLQGLQAFCREKGIIFILDEVQSNFGRTGDWFAFETYGLEPDLVVLGKGLGNGIPVAAVVGRQDILQSLEFGEASDTWSANPLQAAGTLATLEEFLARDVLGHCNKASQLLESGLCTLKEFPFIAHIRGEKGGMVWGIEFQDFAGKEGPFWANRFVLENYLGNHQGSPSGPGSPSPGEKDPASGIHFLGPLAKKVIRVSPPLVISLQQVEEAVAIMRSSCQRMREAVPTPAAKEFTRV